MQEKKKSSTPSEKEVPKEVPIEQEIDKLKKLVALIEDDKVRLDQSFDAFEQASLLVKKLKTRLEVYREKARVIVDMEKENLK